MIALGCSYGAVASLIWSKMLKKVFIVNYSKHFYGVWSQTRLWGAIFPGPTRSAACRSLAGRFAPRHPVPQSSTWIDVTDTGMRECVNWNQWVYGENSFSLLLLQAVKCWQQVQQISYVLDICMLRVGSVFTSYQDFILICTSFRDDINKAFRKLSVLLHPDKSLAPGSEEAFKILVAARTSLLKQTKWFIKTVILRLVFSFEQCDTVCACGWMSPLSCSTDVGPLRLQLERKARISRNVLLCWIVQCDANQVRMTNVFLSLWYL